MEDSNTTTWWLWDATFDQRGMRVVIQVKTVIVDDFRVDTPVAYFGECDSGNGVSAEMGTRIMIDNEQFALLRATGVIQPLSPSWAVEQYAQSETPVAT